MLFRHKSTTNEKTNLMVFLRPTIIRESGRAGQLTSSKYNYIRDQQLRARARGLLLIPDDRSPVLPEFDQQLAVPPGLAPPEAEETDVAQ